MCLGINSFTFWYFWYPNFTLQIGCAGSVVGAGWEAHWSLGLTAANVDSKGVRRTVRASMLKANEILGFAANELHGVKSFAMWCRSHCLFWSSDGLRSETVDRRHSACSPLVADSACGTTGRVSSTRMTLSGTWAGAATSNLLAVEAQDSV